MTGDRAAQIAFLIVALTLPLSALIARRMPVGRTLRLALVWVAIIAGAAILITVLRNSTNFT